MNRQGTLNVGKHTRRKRRQERRLVAVAACLLACLTVWGLLALTGPGAAAFSTEDWICVGWPEAGISYEVSGDYERFYLPEEYREQGILMLGGGDEYRVQLRSFQPEQKTYDQLREEILAETSARASTHMDGDIEVLVYRNTNASAESELYGAALTGADGLLYKVSVFAGDAHDCRPGSVVWKIARAVVESVRVNDSERFKLGAVSGD